MNVLILGSGGREHAFAWKIIQSPLCTQLFVAPGNAGTAHVATNININIGDFKRVADFCFEHQVDLVLVGPEAPLVEGIVDYFASYPPVKHIKIIGPDRRGAQLEGSKDFSKQFMQKYGIPTASYRTFTKENLQEGIDYLQEHTLPIVLKADGLAAGKGVIIAENVEIATHTLKQMISEDMFGTASHRVVVESFLKGIELSVFVLTDGVNYKVLPAAKDYKRVGEGDHGLNTGGMGAVCPVPFADATFMQKVEERIIKPTMRGLQEENINYIGFIFIGLMNVAGDPYVIEYNARMGDPETEVVIPRIKSDFLHLLKLTATRQLSQAELIVDEQVATTVMLVSGGYPEAYVKGKVMKGFNKLKDVLPFHAGTKLSNGEVVTDGGRVIAMTALADTMENALAKSNKAADTLMFEGKYYRRDIGMDLM